MMKYWGLYVLILLLISPGYQGQKKGDKLFKNQAYAAAVSQLEKKLEKDSANFQLQLKLAQAYANINQHKSALENYIDILLAGQTSILSSNDWNRIGHLYLAVNKYRNAELAFQNIENIKHYSAEPEVPESEMYYKSTNLSSINTKYSEFGSLQFKESFVFVSDRETSSYDENVSNWTGTSFLSILKLDTNHLKDTLPIAKNIESISNRINDIYHVGPASFSDDGNTMYFTKILKGKKDSHNAKIYLSNLKNGKWSKPKAISLNSDEYSVAHPVFYDSLNMLVFCSDMPGGNGGMDLYYSHLNNDEWSKPVNFGNEVNTAFNEVFASKRNGHSNEIYFSTNGRFGFGGLDIYKLSFQDNQVESLELLPKSINSNRDDFCVLFTSDYAGYVSSDRTGGEGSDDIYQFEINPIKIAGFVLDNSKKPIDSLKLYLIKDDTATMDSIYTNTDGYFSFLKMPYHNISITPENMHDEDYFLKNIDTISEPETDTEIRLLSIHKDVMETISTPEEDLIVLNMDRSNLFKKYRCIIYDDNTKGVEISITIKDSNNVIISSFESDEFGCFNLKDKFPDKSTIEISDKTNQTLEFEVTNRDSSRSNIITGKHTAILEKKEALTIHIKTNKRCVVYKEGNPAINISFMVKDGQGNILDTLTSSDSGCLSIEKQYPDKSTLELLDKSEFEIFYQKNEDNLVSQNNYIDDKGQIILKKKTVLVDKEIFNSVSSEDTLVLAKIYFDYGKEKLKADSKKELDQLAKIMIDNKNLSVTINAHSDSRGDEKYNLDLSIRRARSVWNYLKVKGVSDKKIQYKGHGESQLINHCSDDVECSEELHEANRRVEFQLKWD